MARILREADEAPAAGVSKRHGFSAQIVHNWLAVGISEAARLWRWKQWCDPCPRFGIEDWLTHLLGAFVTTVKVNRMLKNSVGRGVWIVCMDAGCRS
ncbi:hypothetical protein GAS19_02785 [Burkholderia glumae]|nr:hypothetical protein GAS19_02785 [Burkholderia glumae]QHP90880.1 hypothetical protein EXE55_07995 [Burkholderia glumae]UVS96977.1 hypothetical protein EFP19_15305 [Burkholderia glumae]